MQVAAQSEMRAIRSTTQCGTFSGVQVCAACASLPCFAHRLPGALRLANARKPERQPTLPNVLLPPLVHCVPAGVCHSAKLSADGVLCGLLWRLDWHFVRPFSHLAALHGYVRRRGQCSQSRVLVPVVCEKHFGLAVVPAENNPVDFDSPPHR